MYIDFSETFDTYIPSLSLAFQPANLNENSSTISITPALADFANNLNKENQIQKYENSQTGIKRVSLTEDRRRYRDIKECIDIIIKVSKDNQLYAAAMLAVLLAGMRRHEIPDTEIFVPYNHKSIDLPKRGIKPLVKCPPEGTSATVYDCRQAHRFGYQPWGCKPRCKVSV